jgi:hypothetical protein
VRALLDDSAVLHHQDDVGTADRRQPVANDEGRPAVHQLDHRLLNQYFRAGIDAAGRLGAPLVMMDPWRR